MRNRMEKMKDNAMCGRLLPIAVAGCVLVMLTCAAPCSASNVPAGQIWNVDSDDYMYDWLMVYGTVSLKAGAVVGGVWIWPGGAVNMDPGALVIDGLYIDAGTTVNIWGGTVPYGVYIFNHPGPQPVVTVYGTGFKVDAEAWNADTITPVGFGTELAWTSGDQEFYMVFYGPGYVPVQLESPESGGIAIDIKPGSDTNVINLKSNGVVPVAVLTTGDIEPIDPATVRFAGAAPVHYTLEDVDGDGDDDLLFHFRTQELDLNEQSVEAMLTAQLMGSLRSQSAGQAGGGGTVSGKDKVQIIGSKSKK